MKNQIHENLADAEKLLEEFSLKDAIEFSNWTKEKVKLKKLNQNPDFPIYNNFIYWCNLGINIGSEQNKLRPVLVV